MRASGKAWNGDVDPRARRPAICVPSRHEPERGAFRDDGHDARPRRVFLFFFLHPLFLTTGGHGYGPYRRNT